MILTTDASFKRAFKRLVKKNPQLQDRILAVLELLGNDPFHPSLKSHKLTGKLEGLWSCSVAYDRQVVLAFYQRLQKVVAVLEMKVFGSRARGDATIESDLDVFIKVDAMDRSLRKKIIDVAWEVGFEYDRVISTFIVTEQQLKTGAVGASPLMAKIAQEGVKV